MYIFVNFVYLLFYYASLLCPVDVGLKVRMLQQLSSDTWMNVSIPFLFEVFIYIWK